MKSSLCWIVLVLPVVVFAASPTITVTPETIIQGDPLLVRIEGASIDDIKKFTYQGKTIPLFLYGGKPAVFLAAALEESSGSRALRLEMADGRMFQKIVIVGSRPKLTAPLGIPQKLGGNTKASQTKLVSDLSKENAVLAGLVSTSTVLWNKRFSLPLSATAVTDAYGYSRNTGSYSIAHKGADLRAATGTPVFAIGDGRVSLAREFIVYGKTVGIDHGSGVMSLSMHLSQIAVKKGQKVTRGQTLGLSGESGYALMPHLHLSIKIRGTSIDPMKFFALFK